MMRSVLAATLSAALAMSMGWAASKEQKVIVLVGPPGSGKTTQAQLNRGRRLVEILKQGQYLPMDVELQIASIFAGTKGYLDSLRVEAVLPFEAGLHQFLKSEHADVLSAIVSTGKLEKASEEALAAAIQTFKDRFVKDNTDAVAA